VEMITSEVGNYSHAVTDSFEAVVLRAIALHGRGPSRAWKRHPRTGAASGEFAGDPGRSPEKGGGDSYHAHVSYCLRGRLEAHLQDMVSVRCSGTSGLWRQISEVA